MSADVAVSSWKPTFPCTRAEAEAIDARERLASSTAGADDDRRSRATMPSAGGSTPISRPSPTRRRSRRCARWCRARTAAEPIVEALRRRGLGDDEPGRARADRRGPLRRPHRGAPVAAPPGGRAFLIDAGRAFGTGHHATTSGCLKALDAIRRARRAVDNVIDHRHRHRPARLRRGASVARARIATRPISTPPRST